MMRAVASLLLVALAGGARAETCRFAGTTSRDGTLSAVTTVSESGGTLTVDVALVFRVSAWLTDVEYRSEELTTWRGGVLQVAAVNNRTVLDQRISRQQWDVFTRAGGGLEARRVQARSLAEFQERHGAFARHWAPGGFGQAWLAEYAAARPAARPDLGLAVAGPGLRTPLALAFYWSRFLPAAGGTVPVFLPGFKRDARTDLVVAAANEGPGWRRWQVALVHPALESGRGSALAAWVSPDHYLLQVAADVHAGAGSGVAVVRALGCQGVQMGPG